MGVIIQLHLWFNTVRLKSNKLAFVCLCLLVHAMCLVTLTIKIHKVINTSELKTK